MPLILADEANECMGIAQGYADDLGREDFGSDLLLAALLEDRTVVDALGVAGVQPEAVRSASGVGQRAEPRRMQRPTADAWRVTKRADAERRSREHVSVEPGHLLLAITHESRSSGHRILVDLTADLVGIRDRLESLLPTVELTEEQLRNSVEEFPPLSAEQTRSLARVVARWNTTRPLIRRDEDQLDGEQRAELEWRRNVSGDPLLRLYSHHRHLALAAAKQCACQGHRLHYAFDIAEQRQLGTAIKFNDPNRDFAECAKSAIQDALRETIGCTVRW